MNERNAEPPVEEPRMPLERPEDSVLLRGRRKRRIERKPDDTAPAPDVERDTIEPADVETPPRPDRGPDH